MKALFRKLRSGYIHFVEKQGFPLIITICVAVITATAVWTEHRDDGYVSPTPPVVDNVSAAQLIQQTLRDASTPSPSPTPATTPWSAPLDTFSVVRTFSQDVMTQSGLTGVWTIHDAVDLGCKRGDKVYALADGVVLARGEDQLLGVWLLVDHGSVEALYAGMALAGAYIAGDDVRQGATIGFAGNGVLDETDLGPHLHLRVTKDGTAIDPVVLWGAAE